ncbi:protein SIEVE ELEMENT OCCLUSION B-like protein [Cinnamomum micranthum f. kanehirae]|uniref:Protein SIEVE ELEMENT OCCLUSION B-like protein n=1 Tax=Cinnamomum micranthum f. kanehirae TaxID=337451 RepID=A0A443N769_9MAGN|nr:protein SIEVE ELEMENT OCCLUSION B-like protein [Cinnamomum micranthum f. kanehirae]
MALISKVFNVGGSMSSKQKVVQTQSTPDDKKVIQQIISAHSQDANFAVDERALLSMALDILSKATPTLPLDAKTDSKLLKDKSLQGISDELAFTIHKIGCELSCDCAGGGDMKSITQAVFNTLVKYSWEDKVVIALAAFAVNYGEFCLLSQLHSTNPLAKYVVQLKPLPDISERETLIGILLKVVIDVTKTIIELNDLSSQYISRDKPPFSDAWIQLTTAVYWAIKGIVACSSQSIGLMSMGPEYVVSIIEARKKLTDIAQTLENIHVNLTSALVQCKKKIEEVRINEGYYNIKHLMERTHTNNMEIFIELIHKGEMPLFNGDTKTRVSLNVLKSKTVILFISYFDISDEEIKEIVQQIGKAEKEYEIVWLPIVDKPVVSKEIKDEILRKASFMPWYSLHYTLTLQPYVINYIKNDWHFEKKPLLVAFDAHGKVVNSNAYHMIMIWGSAAYPFHVQREETLWKETKWSLEFLIGGVISESQKWVKERTIFLYGGDDLDWIRKFTATTKEVVKGEGIILELIYVGKKHTETIIKENLSKVLDKQKRRQFQARLDSILYSKMKFGMSIHNDKTLKDVLMLLGSEGSGDGWTVVGHGSEEVVTMNKETVMESLVQFKENKVKFTTQNFFITLQKVVEFVINGNNPGESDGKHAGNGVRSTGPGPSYKKHCKHIYIPSTNGIIPENMVCVDCHRPMEKYIMYKCCIE